eukprot:1292700-Rhodomonas_salina.1
MEYLEDNDLAHAGEALKKAGVYKVSDLKQVRVLLPPFNSHNCKSWMLRCNALIREKKLGRRKRIFLGDTRPLWTSETWSTSSCPWCDPPALLLMLFLLLLLLLDPPSASSSSLLPRPPPISPHPPPTSSLFLPPLRVLD